MRYLSYNENFVFNLYLMSDVVSYYLINGYIKNMYNTICIFKFELFFTKQVFLLNILNQQNLHHPTAGIKSCHDTHRTELLTVVQ